MTPPRVLNWELALHDYCRTIVGRSYAWGETDCVSLWRRAQACMRGVDDATTLFPVLGAWTSATSAARRWTELGGPVKGFLACGAVGLPPTFAQSGDALVATVGGARESVYLLAMGYAFVSDVDEGVTFQEAAPLLALPSAAIFRVA
jgi:hypothetical protein